LAVLRQVGFPVVERTAGFGRKSFTLDGSAVPRLDLCFDEALALFFCRRAAEPLAGTFFWDSVQSAFCKIEASLGARAAKYVKRMLGRVHQTHVGGAYADKAELIDQLLIAIEECRAAFITYNSSRSTEPLTYDIHPYGLIEHRGSLYLVGHSQQHGEVRHWKVDRLEAVDLTKVPFQRPADFDLAQHLSGSLGVYHGREQICVRVRFAPSAVRYIR
jgi:predicted DNA-binding transcriptional regulator YafY